MLAVVLQLWQRVTEISPPSQQDLRLLPSPETAPNWAGTGNGALQHPKIHLSEHSFGTDARFPAATAVSQAVPCLVLEVLYLGFPRSLEEPVLQAHRKVQGPPGKDTRTGVICVPSAHSGRTPPVTCCRGFKLTRVGLFRQWNDNIFNCPNLIAYNHLPFKEQMQGRVF